MIRDDTEPQVGRLGKIPATLIKALEQRVHMLWCELVISGVLRPWVGPQE